MYIVFCANIQIESTSVGTQVTPKDKQKSVDIQTQVTLRSKNRKRGRSVQNPKKKGGTVIGRKKLYGNSSSESAMQTTHFIVGIWKYNRNYIIFVI
jgi:hypothetical protein